MGLARAKHAVALPHGHESSLPPVPTFEPNIPAGCTFRPHVGWVCPPHPAPAPTHFVPHPAFRSSFAVGGGDVGSAPPVGFWAIEAVAAAAVIWGRRRPSRPR